MPLSPLVTEVALAPPKDLAHDTSPCNNLSSLAHRAPNAPGQSGFRFFAPMIPHLLRRPPEQEGIQRE